MVGDYLRLARHADRLAGVIRSDDVPTSVHELRARIGWVIAAYLSSRQREALELLASRSASSRVASGIHAAWSAARRGRPEMLAVDPGLLLPARLHPGGDALDFVDRVGEPEVVDDVVDERSSSSWPGGVVAFIEDGLLAAHGGVALTLR